MELFIMSVAQTDVLNEAYTDLLWYLTVVITAVVVAIMAINRFLEAGHRGDRRREERRRDDKLAQET